MLNLLKKYKQFIILLLLSCFFVIIFTACNNMTGNEDVIDAGVTDIKSDEIEVTKNIDETIEPTKSRAEIEAEQTDTRITDIEYWEMLGYSKDDGRYIYINAFLNGDTATLEELAWIPAGSYDEYKTLKLNKNYSITKEGSIDDMEYILLHCAVTESAVEYLPVGDYSFFVGDGPFGITMEIYGESRETEIESAAYEAVQMWLMIGFMYLLPDYDSLEGEVLEWYNRATAEYIFLTFTHEVGENRWTPAVLQSYAKKYFDIENFPVNCYPMQGGVYDLSYTAHGAHVWCQKYIGETTEDDITTVTVQFFVDASETIKSHTVEYKLQYLDGSYKFLTSTIVYEALFEPKSIQM